VRAPSATDLAAVWTPNPNHPYARARFSGLLAVVFGCVIALVGVYAVCSTWRSLDPPRRRELLVPLTVTAGVFLAVGLAVAALRL
jgi:Co/Zn/Cd efflux system component